MAYPLENEAINNLNPLLRRQEGPRRPVSIQEGKQWIDGTPISYVKTGNGPHALLCLPSTLGSAHTDFKPQLEGLDHERFSIIAWDPPGYGNSRPPERDFSHGFFYRDAEIACRLMEALNFRRFSMLGWSGGGITALIIAAKFPQHVRKCVVWGASDHVTEQEVKIYKGVRNLDVWSEAMRSAMISVYGKEYLQRKWGEFVDVIVNVYHRGGSICREVTGQITCPTLIVHGTKDSMLSPIHPDDLASKISTSRLLKIPNGKHNVHLQYPKDFNTIVSEFLLNRSQYEMHASL